MGQACLGLVSVYRRKKRPKDTWIFRIWLKKQGGGPRWGRPLGAKNKNVPSKKIDGTLLGGRGCERIRTAVRGFADLCLAARPRNLIAITNMVLRKEKTKLKAVFFQKNPNFP